MIFEVYHAADGWRWRLKARNGLITADSAEAYTRKAACLAAVRRVHQRLQGPLMRREAGA